MLHGVTHPCPEDLAVLLVRSNTEKFLLMSNAGGCRPLQGTSMHFSPQFTAIPDTEAVTPPYGSSVVLSPSNYGAQPTFPAPAPAGPYATSLPPAGTTISGTWQLFVMDMAATNRGVIGGWSLLYHTGLERSAQQTLVSVPGVGTGPGPAAEYPITFNLSTVPADVPVTRVTIAIALSHTFPDDLWMVLQSPAGTAVALMGNRGGGGDIAGTVLTFTDFGAALPDGAQINTGTFSPTVFGTTTLPAPAPTGPFPTTLSTFNNEPARGTWRLWVFDDESGDSGQIASALLTMETEVEPNPFLTLPEAVVTTSVQPFLRFEGVVPGVVSPHSAAWRVSNPGVFYAAGMFEFRTGTNIFAADVPLRKGTNSVEYVVRNTRGQAALPAFASRAITVNEFTYSFAEGSTGSFFDLDLTVANPTGSNAPITIDLLRESGGTLTVTDTVDANTPFQLAVDSVVPNAALSSIVHSADAVPLAVERTMIWDASGYGGHGATSVAPATRWLFAEGSQGFFNTFVLLANDNATATNVTVRFLLEGGGVVNLPVSVPAKTRRTIFAGDISALVNQSFGIDVTSTLPIIAERAMYLPGARVFEGGHESAGVNATSTQWFLAEGATGSFFECFVLLSNPNPTPATVTLTYLLPSGATIPQTVVVPANGRHTINVETIHPDLATADVSTTVVSDIGIVVERAMYWPDLSVGWREAHNSFGLTHSALRWGVADGRVGGPRGYQTFILLANPSPFPAEVEVRFLKPTFTVTKTYTLSPKSRRNIWANGDVPELGEGTFSADIRVLNFQPIAVEKALYWNSGSEAFAGGTNVTATRLPPP
jgi:subtilisin-like proprotein convertase family protein